MRKHLYTPGLMAMLASSVAVMAAEDETGGGSTKSIIDPKYQGKYKEKDWLGKFIDDNATIAVTKEKQVKDEEGNVTGTETVETGKRKLDLDALFTLCKANSIDTASMEAQRDRPNAPGRIRMTLGNRLRAAAKHRHGLYDVNQSWTDAPAEFIGDAEKTHNPDGSKIKVEKPEPETAEGESEDA